MQTASLIIFNEQGEILEKHNEKMWSTDREEKKSDRGVYVRLESIDNGCLQYELLIPFTELKKILREKGIKKCLK